jgi:enoyl-CoA hydratase
MSGVSLSIDGNVATITIDAEKTRNALSPESSRELVELCDRIDADTDIGAAVVCGANGTFCSGAERGVLARAGQDPAADENVRDIGAVYGAFVRVGNLGVPTVAAVRGAAVGAGVNLLLATDLRIIAEDARIITGFARIGLHPGGGHFTLLGRIAGWEAAAALGVFAEEIDGTRAAELGIAWSAVPDSQVEPTAYELAARAAKDPVLARRIVWSFRREMGPPAIPWESAVELERASQMWSLRRRNPG